MLTTIARELRGLMKSRRARRLAEIGVIAISIPIALQLGGRVKEVKIEDGPGRVIDVRFGA